MDELFGRIEKRKEKMERRSTGKASADAGAAEAIETKDLSN
jgi:hypothetical protein